MGLKVDDNKFVDMMKEVASGTWDILNWNFNRGSEYTITFFEKAQEDIKERVRISKRMVEALTQFSS